MNLREIREAAGFSQAQVAAGLGLSEHSGRKTVSQIEQRRDWLLSSVAAYIKACGGTAELVVNVNGETLVTDL